LLCVLLSTILGRFGDAWAPKWRQGDKPVWPPFETARVSPD
jgi:hypothetical protein